MEETYKKLKEEIEVMKSNQTQSLKDYGKRVSKIDKELTILEDKHSGLVSEIKKLTNRKDSLYSEIIAEAKEIREEARAILADSKTKKEKVDHAAVAVDNQAREAGEKAKQILDKASRHLDKARANDAKTYDIVKDLRVKVEGADALKVSLKEKIVRANNIIAKNEKKEDLINDQIESSKLDQESLELKIKENKLEYIDLAQKIQYNRDLADKNEKKSVSLDEELALAKESKEKNQKEHDKLMVVLKEQGENNDIRSLELDAGFEKYKALKRYTDAEIKKLKEIKDQLNK